MSLFDKERLRRALVEGPVVGDWPTIYPKLILSLVPAGGGITWVDPDGPHVPLPVKPEPVRVVPAFPLTTYQVMLR